MTAYKAATIPLGTAAANGDGMTVRLKVYAGVEKDRMDLALRRAAAEGNVGIMEFLANHGAKIDGAAFVRAAQSGHVPVVKKLLELGADINSRADTIDHDTALTKVAGDSKVEIAKFLLDNGADVNARNDDGETAMIIAVDRYFNRPEALETVKLLVESGADVNVRNKRGETALIRAIVHDEEDMMKVLIGAGADVNVKNRNGENILFVADRKSDDVFKLLLEAGVDPNVKNKQGHTPLQQAVRRDKHGVVKLLLASGAKLDIDRKYLAALLRIAARVGDVGRPEGNSRQRRKYYRQREQREEIR